MKIIKAFPPNYNKIAKAFPYVRARLGVLYAYGEKLYNPSGVQVPAWLMAHEEVHKDQQLFISWTPGVWWDKYIDDLVFRAEEETEAHRAEWNAYRSAFPQGNHEHYLNLLVARLAGPLYGSMLTLEEARHEITRIHARRKGSYDAAQAGLEVQEHDGL